MACERCEKAGDLMCFMDPDGHLILALHADSTVALGITEQGALDAVLESCARLYAFALTEAAHVLSQLAPDAAKPAKDVAAAEAGYNLRYARWYCTVQGAVREWMRANGRTIPYSHETPPGPRPTQAAGRA